MEDKHSYRKNLCLEIAALECTRVGRSQYDFNGIDIWPALRADICKAIEEKVIAPGRVFANLQPALKQFQQQLENSQDSLKENYTPRSIRELATADDGKRLLFHTRATRHQISTSGESVCGQIDFLYRLLEHELECVKVEELTWQANNLHPRFIEPYYFDTPSKNDFLACVKLLSPSWPWPEESSICESYKTLFENIGVTKNVPDHAGLRTRLTLMQVYAHIFEDVLRHLNPAAVFTDLYYNSEVWGLLLAAKRLGIPTIEVQHGLVGRYQWIMTHWSSIPESGFDLLPDYFWCFDEETKENITDSNSAVSSFRPIVGGIPKLAHWSKHKNKSLRPEYKQYLSDLENEDFVVLVALNYNDYLPQNLLFAIKQLPKNWRWLIRLHPMSTPAQNLIAQTYRSLGLENVEFHYATRVPIYDLLDSVDHLVTGYSTIATEALPFGIGITLSDPTGSELYPQFIADGRMSVGISGDALVSILKLSASNRTNAKDTSSTPQILDRSIEALGELFQDFGQRRLEIEKRMERLDQSPFFQKNPIDGIKEQSNELSNIRDRREKQQAQSPTSTSQNTLLQNQTAANEEEANDDPPRHMVDRISILPILKSLIVGQKAEAKLAGEFLECSIAPHLKEFEKRLRAEVRSSRRSTESYDADLLFYDLEKNDIRLNKSKNGKPRLLFVSHAGQYGDIDTKSLDSPFYTLAQKLSQTFDPVKLEIYSPQSLKVETAELSTKFIRTPWNGITDIFAEEYLDLFQWCSEQNIIDALNALKDAQHNENRITKASLNIALSIAYMQFFEMAIQVEQPGALFIDNADIPENWGATLAAKKLRVPVVQVLSTRLSKCLDIATEQRKLVGEADGFIADYYWCTNEKGEVGIDVWSSTLNHIVHAGANASGSVLNVPKDHYIPSLTPEGRSYRKFVQNADRVVLVTLAEDCRAPLPLLSSMQKLPQTWMWLIHVPRSGLCGADIISSQFYKAGIDNFELQFAGRLPLIELVSQGNAFVVIEGSMECELSASDIDYLLLGPLNDVSAEAIVKSLLESAERASQNKKPFVAAPSKTLDVLLSDWRARNSTHTPASDEPRFGAFYRKLPSLNTLWRRHYLRKDTRTSKFALVPQGNDSSRYEENNKTLALLPIDPGKGTSAKGAPIPANLNQIDIQSTLEHLGPRRSFNAAIKLGVLALGRKVAPRRRLLNIYQRLKNQLRQNASGGAKTTPIHKNPHQIDTLSTLQHLGSRRSLKVAIRLAGGALRRGISPRRRLENGFQGRQPSLRQTAGAQSGKPSVMTVAADLALVDSYNALFSLIQKSDRFRKTGGHEKCQLILFYDPNYLNGLQNWAVFNRIAPIFSGLLPNFSSVRIVPDYSEALRLLDAMDDSRLYRWTAHDHKNTTASGDPLPKLLHEECRPIVADDESKRFANQWRMRACRDRRLVTISFGSETDRISEKLIDTLNDTASLFHQNGIDVVILPSPTLELDALAKRIANRSILEECRYNQQLRAAFFEVADQNILIGGGVNGLAMLSTNTRWCYMRSDLDVSGRASDEQDGNVVFKEMPSPDELLKLVV